VNPPDGLAKKLPRHPVPVTPLARFAVDQSVLEINSLIAHRQTQKTKDSKK